jgi:hypothetical protein
LISITSSAGSIWLGVSLALALGGWGCKLTAGDVEACWIGPEGSIIGAFLNALSDCPFLIRLQTMRKTCYKPRGIPKLDGRTLPGPTRRRLFSMLRVQSNSNSRRSNKR